MKRQCTIEACGKPYLAKGFCSKHYTQWRKHGDPTRRVIAKRGASLEWIKAHVGHQGGDCLIWPFKPRYKKGYGAVWHLGRLTGAHRVMCILAHGDPPFEGAAAAHLCGRGRDGCVHPNHLRWATQAENEADKVRHGTRLTGERNPQARLTEMDVTEIRRRVAAGETHSAIANDYDVSRSTISYVVRGETWRERYELGEAA